MTDEIDIKSENAQDGDKVAKDETQTDSETKETKETKPRSVSFNRDVHVKRFGKPRESRGASSEVPTIRKEPFTHLSEQELIDEANKVIAQAQSVTCTTEHPPEKFFSLPNRRKLKEDRSGRRNSDDGGTPEGKRKTALGRSTSDVTSKKRKERTSLSTLFRRAQRNKSPDAAVVVTTKPVAVVKRSKSDVSDLKSNTTLINSKPIRKRSGSESEEFLKSLRNKKTQLSPIIESSPREDYFQKTSPLEAFQKQKETQENNIKTEENKLKSDFRKVNPVVKPPRYRTPENSEPKPPSRTKKGKSTETIKDKSPLITNTPKSKADIKKNNIFIDEVDSTKVKESGLLEVKGKIKESIRKIRENIYGGKEMIHSSQKPPEKPPLTRGNTVDQMVRILKEDQNSLPPKLNSPTNGSNMNQPFSYTKPSTSPDPNLFIRSTSPDRILTPINKMTDKDVVYAHVVRDRGDVFGKQTVHKTYSPTTDKYGNFSDEDEGLGYEEKNKYSSNIKYDFEYKGDRNDYNTTKAYKITDSPIRPKFREYKLTSFEDMEPTYANEYPSKENNSPDYIDRFRGRADGMDTKRKQYEPENHKIDLDFNELSHRRQLLESRINARRVDRERNAGEPISRYLAETDPIYEAQKRMKATEKYVNETAKYYRHTLERDGFAESTVTEDYSKYDSDNHKVKYNTETRTYQKTPKGEIDRKYIDSIPITSRYSEERKVFPPEPEYEPPSLEFTVKKPVLSPDEYKEKKYKAKKHFTSSHDILQTGQKYKVKEERFGKRKGHYASNPEIAQEREDDYANIPYLSKQPESYHNSLRRSKSKDRHKAPFGIYRHDSGDSRDYYRENGSPRRYEVDNRLVDSGIENDFRKDSSGEIHRSSRNRRQDSYDDVRDTSLFLDSERRHTEDNYPSEQIYANGEYLARFEDFRHNRHKKEYSPRETSAEGRTRLDLKIERYEKSPNNNDDQISAKPPKAKKLSGLERVKQLFSRDSSKKSKKEKDAIQPKSYTRVLKSPEHLARDDSDYRRYTDPEPSDIVDIRKKSYDTKEEERLYRNSREDLDIYRNSDPRDSDTERKYRDINYDGRYEKKIKERRHKDYKEEKRRHHSSDRESDRHSRPSDGENELRKSKPRTAGPADSLAMAERYRERRRLATPSPTPSPPRRQPPAPPPASSGSWFKSLERVGRKRDKSNKREESILTTEDELVRKSWSKPKQPLNSPAKNLRFFGDTDPDSDSNTVKHSNVAKSKSHPHSKPHSTLKKTLSNSSTGIDEVDQSELSSKSYSLTNLHRQEKSESPRTRQYYKRSLHNISETQGSSEAETNTGKKKLSAKPPMSPYDRRSRSQSSSKTLRGSKGDVRRNGRSEDRGSSSDLRSSKQDISRDSKLRHRTPAPASGESSTEGDSSHHSQRSVVYLHATTVGDIPDPGRRSHNRSRDDVSSVNSSNLQVRTTTKSFSLFAPWTPKHYHDQHDVHYAQKPRKTKTKETVTKSPPSSKITPERPSTLQKNKSYSQSTLSKRPQNNRLTSSNTTLYRKPIKSGDENHSTSLMRKTGRDGRKSQSNEVLSRSSDSERVSRSISMPKDNNKKAGWFKLSNKNKKQEINTRVR